MATKIEGGTLPPKRVGKRRRQGAREKYPWTQWFDGNLWRLTRGEDFTVATESFRTAALAAAARYGVKLGTRRIGSSVILLQVTGTATKPETEKKTVPAKKVVRGWRFWQQEE